MASVKISESLNKVKTIKSSSFPIFDITKSKQVVSIQPVLPFKIKFINIGIPGYSANNPAPIGIAIVGFTNYIL